MMPVVIRLLADALLIAALAFTSAGTLAWTRVWVLVTVMLAIRAATAIAVHRVNPALLRDRAKLPLHTTQPRIDRLLLLGVLGTGFIALPVVAGLDAFHFHLLPRPPAGVSGVGLVLFVLGWTVKGLALRANAFATSVIRVQREQTVIDSGVYRVVRHPFYVGTALVLAGMPLWLESYAATVFVVVPMSFVMMRILFEERFLMRELSGYRDYTSRVRRRLIPGIW